MRRIASLALTFFITVSAWAESAPSADGAFSSSERLLSTYFFWRGPWDDTVVTSGRKLGMSGTWKAIYPSPDDPRASIFGLDSPSKWPGSAIPDTGAWPATYRDGDKLQPWLMAEWRAMKWSGFDFVLLDDWHCLCFKPDLSPQPCFEALARAWLELDRRGEKPLPFAMFLETPFAWYGADKKDRDATWASADGIVELWEPARAFLRQFYGEKDHKPILPLRALARILVGREPRPVVHFWFPTWEGGGLRKWDAWTFQELRRKCRETFGVEPFVGVNQHVHGRDFVGGWSSDQPGGGRADITSGAGAVDYDVSWWGGMAGPQIQRDAIALGPGHWCPRQTGQKPVTLHWSSAYAPDSTRYEHCWRRVLSQPDSFQRKILIVESWNNSDEGCAISYSEPKDFLGESGQLIDRWGDRPELYMELTREFARAWKEGRCPDRFLPSR